MHAKSRVFWLLKLKDKASYVAVVVRSRRGFGGIGRFRDYPGSSHPGRTVDQRNYTGNRDYLTFDQQLDAVLAQRAMEAGVDPTVLRKAISTPQNQVLSESEVLDQIIARNRADAQRQQNIVRMEAEPQLEFPVRTYKSGEAPEPRFARSVDAVAPAFDSAGDPTLPRLERVFPGYQVPISLQPEERGQFVRKEPTIEEFLAGEVDRVTVRSPMRRSSGDTFDNRMVLNRSGVQPGSRRDEVMRSLVADSDYVVLPPQMSQTLDRNFRDALREARDSGEATMQTPQIAANIVQQNLDAGTFDALRFDDPVLYRKIVNNPERIARNLYLTRDDLVGETFSSAVRTNLPDDTPIPMRGRSGARRLEDQLLNRGSLEAGTIDPSQISTRSSDRPASTNIDMPFDIEFITPQGVKRRMIDPNKVVRVDSELDEKGDTIGKQVTLGRALQALQDEYKTPVITRDALMKSYREGRFKVPDPGTEPEGSNLIGYLADPGDPKKSQPIYKFKGSEKEGSNPIYRVGNPMNRDVDKLREAIIKDPAIARALGVKMLYAPDTRKRISLSEFREALDRGFVLRSAGSKEPLQLSDIANAINQGSPLDRLEVARSVDGPSLRTLVFNPKVRGYNRMVNRMKEGPAFLSDDWETRVAAEVRGDGSLEGLLSAIGRAGSGSPNQVTIASNPEQDLAKRVIAGEINPDDIKSSSGTPLLREGSFARKLLDQAITEQKQREANRTPQPQALLGQSTPWFNSPSRRVRFGTAPDPRLSEEEMAALIKERRNEARKKRLDL